MKWSVLAGCLFLLSCQQKQETTTPVIQDITESVYASGKVKSHGQYEVFATVSGIVKQVKVTEGSEVKKGDVLMTIANETPSLQTQNAQLALEYQSLQANRNKLSEAQAAIDFSRTKLLNDSLLLHRQRKLWEAGIGSRMELEQRELTAKNSTTNYQTAVLRYLQLKKELAFADKQARNALQVSTTLNNDYTIRAHRDGKVYAINKEPGELISPQAPVAVVGDASGFVLELQVDEYDISKVTLGQKVFVTMDSYKGQVFEATISKINPLMNERSRSITVEALFLKQPPTLLPNLSVEGNILIRSKQNALTIPRSYLLDDNHVLLQNGEKRKVSVGLKDYQQAEIISGIDRQDVLKKPLQ